MPDWRDRRRARVRRGDVKLREGTALRKPVFARIKLAWSPRQISGGLRAMDKGDLIGPKLPGVSHETVYGASHVQPRGEMRKELAGLLRQRKAGGRRTSSPTSHARPFS